MGQELFIEQLSFQPNVRMALSVIALRITNCENNSIELNKSVRLTHAKSWCGRTKTNLRLH